MRTETHYSIIRQIFCGLKLNQFRQMPNNEWIVTHRYIPNRRICSCRNNPRSVTVIVCMEIRAANSAISYLILFLIVIGLLVVNGPAMAASVGDIAPNFEIATQDGNVLRLSEFRGRKPVYVIFWNTWCSYCVKKTPRYQKLQEQFGDKIEIIAINTSWSDSP